MKVKLLNHLFNILSVWGLLLCGGLLGQGALWQEGYITLDVIRSANDTMLILGGFTFSIMFELGDIVQSVYEALKGKKEATHVSE